MGRMLVTGARGTVGRALCAHLTAAGHDVADWDRRVAPPADRTAAAALLRDLRPETVFHLAVASTPTGLDDEGRVVNVEWPIALAELTRALGIGLVFTSTAMVFSNDAIGPFTVESVPDARDGYGADKRRAEVGVLESNPGAVVARIGWQIGTTFGASAGTNHMLEHFERQVAADGCVRASRLWFPACSFLEDTAATLADLRSESGIFHVDSNERWTFHEIAGALSRLHRGRWPVESTEDFEFDQRMVDPRVGIRGIAERLFPRR